MLVITARPRYYANTQFNIRLPAGVMVIDSRGGAVHMTFIINTCIIAGILYVVMMAPVTAGLVF